MKRLFVALLLCSFACAALSGCEKDKTPDPRDKPPAQQPAKDPPKDSGKPADKNANPTGTGGVDTGPNRPSK